MDIIAHMMARGVPSDRISVVTMYDAQLDLMALDERYLRCPHCPGRCHQRLSRLYLLESY